MNDLIIYDFSNTTFQPAFKKYFAELRIEVKDWDGLFQGMNKEQDNVAIVRTPPRKTKPLGFIQFRIDLLKNWFFEEKIGFIREFWVSDPWRHAAMGLLYCNPQKTILMTIKDIRLCSQPIPRLTFTSSRVCAGSFLLSDQQKRSVY